MKKFILLASAMFALTAASAQDKEVVKIEKSLEKSDLAIADAKKATLATTWIDRGNLFIDMANVYTKSLIQGFGLTQIQSAIGAPKSTEAVEFKGVQYNLNEFDKFDVYTNSGDNMIAFWLVNEYPIETPLESAYESLVKAKELSSKEFEGAGKGSIAAGRLQAIYQADGMAHYSLDNSEDAAELFLKSFEVGELTDSFDTVFLYYAGICFYESAHYAKAISALDKVFAAGSDQEGMVYYYMADSYSQLGDTQKAIDLLEEGFAKYPTDNTIMGTLINVYMTSKQDPSKIVEVIKAAQELDPSNTSLYMVESTIYNEMGDSEKAYAVLDKVINEIDPAYFGAYYNYAIMKVLDAQALNEEAAKLDLNDVKGYNDMMDQIIALQAEAIEILEKAHEIEKENVAVIELLKQLYFPRRDEEGAKERYEYFDALSNQ
ncbi:MAG: tetratricopeptide repeat protein [Rikenellaceae bacterium]